MKRLALVFAATRATAAHATPADPVDELSGDEHSPQRHLVPAGAHEPFIEDSDGTIHGDGSITLTPDKRGNRVLLSLTP